MKGRMILSFAALAALVVGTACLTAQDKKKSGDYGKGKREVATATAKTVKLTVENKSGKDIRFVSWRFERYDLFYNADLPKDGTATQDIYAEWRINGVWAMDGTSTPGWATAYNFEKDTTITIEKDKLIIK